MRESRLLYRVEIRGVDEGWEIVDWVQEIFCKKKGVRISRSVANGAAGKRAWKKKRGKIVSFPPPQKILGYGKTEWGGGTS
jgi:hypothetical protein